MTKNIAVGTERIGSGDPNYDRYVDEQFEPWDTIEISGQKVLDLNGFAISVDDNSNWMRLENENCYTIDYGAQGRFCHVTKGTELTINDSVGGGSVYYDGYMIGSNAPGAFGGTTLLYRHLRP